MAIKPTEVRNELAAPNESSRVPKDSSASRASLVNGALWKLLASEPPRTTTSVMIPAAPVTRPSVRVVVATPGSCWVVRESVIDGASSATRGLDGQRNDRAGLDNSVLLIFR